jgi:hypothetical protein
MGRRALTTDKLWKCTSVEPEYGWEKPSFPDASWPQAIEYGANGVAPWGFISGIDPDVKWIGTANPADMDVFCRVTVPGCGPDEARNKVAESNVAWPQRAFDGDLTTSWTGQTGSWLQVDLGQPTVVGRVNIVWGYDTSRGASADSTLEYSFDKLTWYPGATLTHTPETSGKPQAQPLARVSARYWRLKATRWHDGTGYVKDWQLLYPCDLCDRDMAYKRPASSSGFVWGNKPYKAFDGDDSTTWSSNLSTGAYLQVDLGQPMGIEGARVKWGWDANYGSSATSELRCRTTVDPDAPDDPNTPNDDWKYLATLTHTQATSGTPQTVSFPRTDCRHVRLLATQWNDGWGYVSDFQVHGACAPCNSLSTGKTATASSQVGASSPHLAVDGSFGTAWQSAGSTGSSLNVDLGSCQDFGQARLSWGLSNCPGTPAQSVLKGSNNGATWDTLVTFNQRTREQHLRQNVFWVPNACYRYLRLEASNWQGCTGGVTELQVCDGVGRPGRPVP